ncbi:SCO family protein [Roseovarius nanhaiticus]|uniref:SCO family protein n=1 Tax=Roseovarius nanhaiticus TaxID=573024 RepID=UPI002492ACA5|nr:SCO family protein [Roseovarius nanhaiticus]
MIRISGFVMIGALTVCAAASAAQDSAAFVQGQISLPQMTLVDHHARPHALRGELDSGALLVMTFSYTLCGSICPIGNDIMAQLDDEVGTVGGRDVRLLSVTIDPQNDTPAMMAEAAQKFGASDRWLWLTGHPGDIRRLLQSVGAPVHNLELHDPVFLVGDGQTGEFFRTQTMPSVDELLSMLNAISS